MNANRKAGSLLSLLLVLTMLVSLFSGLTVNAGAADVPEDSSPFADVRADDYFYEAVLWAAEGSVTYGTTETTFSPDDTCTRGQALTFLYRSFGEPAVSEEAVNPFTDVQESDYYYNAVLWGAVNGIVYGTSGTTFSPDEPITRADLLCLLYRAAQEPDTDGTRVFSDVQPDAYYADAILWGYENGVVAGSTATLAAPADTCLRAQTVTFLYRFMNTSACLAAAFYALNGDEQLAAFEKLDGRDTYQVVSESPSSSWCVTAYNLVTEENVRDFVVVYRSGDSVAFNLNWPIYGGYDPETIMSIGELSGTIAVSRVGGDGGYTMCYGTNEDGSQYTCAQRSLPETSSWVTTGMLNVDLYKQSAEVVSDSALTDEEKLAGLAALGFSEDSAVNMLSNYYSWLGRSEIAGENSIPDGIASVGHEVAATYGYCGICAAWAVSGLTLEGGCGQMNTIYSWGTLKASGLVTDTESVEIG